MSPVSQGMTQPGEGAVSIFAHLMLMRGPQKHLRNSRQQKELNIPIQFHFTIKCQKKESERVLILLL